MKYQSSCTIRISALDDVVTNEREGERSDANIERNMNVTVATQVRSSNICYNMVVAMVAKDASSDAPDNGNQPSPVQVVLQ